MENTNMPISFSYGMIERYEAPCLLVSSDEYLSKIKEDEDMTIETLRLAIAFWLRAITNHYNEKANYFENPEMIVNTMNLWANTFSGTFLFGIKEKIIGTKGLVWIELVFCDKDGFIETVISGEVDKIIQTPFSPAKSVSLMISVKTPIQDEEVK